MAIALSLDDFDIRTPPMLLESPSPGPGDSTGAEEDFGRFANETLANLERLVARAEREVESQGVEILDGLIDHLATIEEETRTTWKGSQAARDTARRVRGELEELSATAPGRAELLKGVEEPLARIDRWIEAAESVLPAYRDTRWKLMALRADHEDPGDAPVFDDPEQLKKYLASG